MTVNTNFMEVEDPGIALITGASSGIGETFVRILSSQGFDLVITARRKNRLELLAAELKEKHGVNIDVISGDLALDSYKNRDIIVITGDHNVEEVVEWRAVAYEKPGRYFSRDFSKTGLVIND